MSQRSLSLPGTQLKDTDQAPGIARRLLVGRESLIVWLTILLGWYLLTFQNDASRNPLLPSPWVVGSALLQSLPELLSSAFASSKILIPGYLLAVALAIPFGLLVGTRIPLQRAFIPFARVAAPVPPTVYIPYAIAVLPTFHLSAVFIVFIGAFWPIFHNTALGAASTPQRWKDSAKIMQLGRLEYLLRIVLPASLPQIFSGLGVGLVFAFILLTIAELFGAVEGLGRFVQIHADYANYPQMLAGILFTGAIAASCMSGLEALRRRVLFWYR
jgi:NitT/TauT family transport system permease protein